jgi:hypothetical protein
MTALMPRWPDKCPRSYLFRGARRVTVVVKGERAVRRAVTELLAIL